MNRSRNRIRTATINTLILGLAALTMACSTSSSASSPAQGVPKTLEELNALELERDYVQAKICWETAYVAQEYQQIREHQRWGTMGSPQEHTTFAAIRPKLDELRADELNLANLNRRINAARDAASRK